MIFGENRDHNGLPRSAKREESRKTYATTSKNIETGSGEKGDRQIGGRFATRRECISICAYRKRGERGIKGRREAKEGERGGERKRKKDEEPQQEIRPLNIAARSAWN